MTKPGGLRRPQAPSLPTHTASRQVSPFLDAESRQLHRRRGCRRLVSPQSLAGLPAVRGRERARTIRRKPTADEVARGAAGAGRGGCGPLPVGPGRAPATAQGPPGDGRAAAPGCDSPAPAVGKAVRPASSTEGEHTSTKRRRILGNGASVPAPVAASLLHGAPRRDDRRRQRRRPRRSREPGGRGLPAQAAAAGDGVTRFGPRAVRNSSASTCGFGRGGAAPRGIPPIVRRRGRGGVGCPAGRGGPLPRGTRLREGG
jgi:hypothetical protein